MRIFSKIIKSSFLLFTLSACSSPTPETPTKFKVTWDYNMIEGSQTSEVNKFERITDVPNPIHDNYVFEGWFEDRECRFPIDLNDRIFADVTYYAYWSNLDLSKMTSLFGTYATKIGDFHYNRANLVGSTEDNKIDGVYPILVEPNRSIAQIIKNRQIIDYYYVLLDPATLFNHIRTIVPTVSENNYYQFFYATGKSKKPLINIFIRHQTLSGQYYNYTINIDDLGYISYYEIRYENGPIFNSIRLMEVENYSTVINVKIDPGFLKGQVNEKIIQIHYGDLIDIDNLPSVGVFDFDGYYYDQKCTDILNSYMCVTNDLTIYAGWHIDPSKYQDIFNLYSQYNDINNNRYNFMTFSGITELIDEVNDQDSYVYYDVTSGTAKAKVLCNGIYADTIIGYNKDSFVSFFNSKYAGTNPTKFLIGSINEGENLLPYFMTSFDFTVTIEGEDYNVQEIYYFNPYGYIDKAFDFMEGYFNFDFEITNYSYVENTNLTIKYSDPNISDNVITLNYPTKGNEIVFPEAPTKENYRIHGYYQDCHGDNTFSKNEFILNDMNAYAAWEFTSSSIFKERYSSYFDVVSSEIFSEVRYDLVATSSDGKTDYRHGRRSISYDENYASISFIEEEIFTINAFKNQTAIDNYINTCFNPTIYDVKYVYILDENGKNYLTIIGTSLASDVYTAITAKFDGFGYLRMFEYETFSMHVTNKLHVDYRYI